MKTWNVVRRQLGFTAIEMMVVLIVAIGAMVLGGDAYNTYINNLDNQSAAQHATSVRDAAQKYIKDNYASLEAVATATTPATITIPMLQTTNYLPASFNAVNNFGQSYAIEVLQPTAGKLQSLIVTTGRGVIPELGLRRTAQIIGAQGGYISSTNPSVATGSYGGWSTPLPGNYGVSPGAGHLAVALFFADSGTVSDYLYRNSVAGRPDLNTMNTPIIMSSVQTAGGACTTTGAIARDAGGAVLSCQANLWKTQGSAYWQDPVANVATLNGTYPCTASIVWQTRIVQTPTVGTGPRAYTCDGFAWQPLGLDDNGNFTLPGGTLYAGGAQSTYGGLTVQGSKNGWSGINFKDSTGANSGTLMMSPTYSGFFNAADNAWRWYVDNNGNSIQSGTAQANMLQVNAVATVGAACSPNGLIAKDSTGLILSCQSGSWQKASGSSGKPFGGAFMAGGLNSINPATGAVNCPAGYAPYQVAYFNTYAGPSSTFICY